MILATTGCRERSKPAVPAPAPIEIKEKAGGSLDSMLPRETPSPPPPPTPDTPPVAAVSETPPAAAPPPGVFTPSVEQAAGQMSMFVQQFFYEKGRLPKDLKELVAPNYLPYIYPAPAGKKWVIDPKAKGVKLADQ